MPILGIRCSGVSRKAIVNFLTATLCGVKEKQRKESVSQRHILEKKNNQKKEQADVVFLVSPKVGLGNSCPMLSVEDVVP